MTHTTRRILLLVLVLSVTYSTQVGAREWSIVGPRALGMGGAHVAVANDAFASYWNPAAYGFFNRQRGGYYGDRTWSCSPGVGVGAQIHEDLGERLDSIFTYKFDDLDNGQIRAEKVSDFLQLLNELKTFNDNDKRTAMVLAHSGFGLQMGHVGIGAYAFGEVTGKGSVDLINIAPVSAGTTGANLITQLADTSNLNNGTAVPAGDYYFDAATKNSLITTIAALDNWDTTTATNFVQAADYGLLQAQQSGVNIPSDITTTITNVSQLADDAQTGGSFADNESKLLFKGIAVAETPLTYGLAITEDFAIGLNAKYMKARVYNTSVDIFDTDFEDALDNAMDFYEESQNFGLDLGFLYKFGDDFRVGVVGRNLNSPEFDMRRRIATDPTTMEEKAQIRAGIACRPANGLTLAVDMDLTENETTVSNDYESRNVACGLEYEILSPLKLRAGAYKNLAESDIGHVYTAGLGIQFWHFSLDTGASMASESTEIDGNTVPKEIRAELALSILF